MRKSHENNSLLLKIVNKIFLIPKKDCVSTWKYIALSL